MIFKEFSHEHYRSLEIYENNSIYYVEIHKNDLMVVKSVVLRVEPSLERT